MYLYIIIKTNNKMIKIRKIQKGDKFQKTIETFGKEITTKITVVLIHGNKVLMDDGSSYDVRQLINLK
tara:strand:+ start:826 stop:1029 length:204 start_codon:yes stop_codon:yes gene_type:complete